MKIGLVIPTTDEQSETFFTTFLNCLTEKGFEIILLPNRIRRWNNKYKVRSQHKVYQNRVIQKAVMVFVLTNIVLRNFLNVRSFIKLERADGKSAVEVLKSTYLCAHILHHRLDWLHFGFGTMVLGKENVAKAIGAKMGVSFRGSDAFIFPIKNPNCYNNIWHKVDKIHVVSKALENRVKELSKHEEIIIQVIVPAVEVKEHKVLKKEIISAKKILTIARLHWVKGLEYAIHAMKILDNSGKLYQYDIIGYGAEYEKLLFLIHDLGLQNKVNLLGVKTHLETQKLIKEYDIYLQPSLSEGFSNAVLEAQANGLLCIVSAVGGLKENIEDGKTGKLVDAYSAIQIALGIQEFINFSYDEEMSIIKMAKKNIAKKNNLVVHSDSWVLFFK